MGTSSASAILRKGLIGRIGQIALDLAEKAGRQAHSLCEIAQAQFELRTTSPYPLSEHGRILFGRADLVGDVVLFHSSVVPMNCL